MARKSEETVTKTRKRKPIVLEMEHENDDETMEMDFDEEIDDSEPPRSLEPSAEDPVSDILAKLKGEVEDIFVDLGDRAYKEAGTALRYTVYKDGFRVGEFRHPCTWDFLQKKFGGGSYKVQAKSPEGKFLKQQSQMLMSIEEERKPVDEVKGEIAQVADLVKQVLETRKDQSNDSLPMMMAMIQQQQQQTQLMMTQMQEQAKMQLAQMQQQTQAQMNMMMTILGSSKDESANMSLKLAEIQRDAARQVTEANNRIFEIILKQKPEKTGPDAMEIIKLKSEAEKEGFDRAKEMFELIDEKSEAIAERKAERLLDRDEEPEKKSTMDKVIETLAPALGTVLSQATQPRPRAMVAPEAVRRAPVPPIQAPRSSTPPSVMPVTAQPVAVQPAPAVKKVAPVMGVTPIKPPTVAEKTEIQEKPVIEAKIAEVKMSEEPAPDVSKIREDLKTLSQEVLIAGYMSGKTTSECAEEVLAKAQSLYGISKHDVLRIFPKSEIIEIGKEKGLSGDLMKLVEDFADKIHS